MLRRRAGHMSGEQQLILICWLKDAREGQTGRGAQSSRRACPPRKGARRRCSSRGQQRSRRVGLLQKPGDQAIETRAGGVLFCGMYQKLALKRSSAWDKGMWGAVS
eukprot:1161129-Pelagomonas_calceolata.AAC.10